MDIQLPLNSFNPSTLTKLTSLTTTLQVGQQLDVQVLNTASEAGKLSVSIKLGNNTVTLQGDNFVNLAAGQVLQLQVLKLTPTPEFKLIDVKNAALQSLANTSQNATASLAESLNPQPVYPLASTGIKLTLSPNPTFSRPELALPLAPSTPETTSTQTVEFKIVGFVGNKVQLQILPATNDANLSSHASNTIAKAPTMLIDRSQLQQLLTTSNNPSAPAVAVTTSELKVGQQLTIEISKSAGNTEFKIIPNNPASTETQITQLVKQLLPKHETAPVFLTQVKHDLPQLLLNPQVPVIVKALLKTILANIPDTAVLNTGTSLKQSVKDAGLLLEAQLAAELAQTDQNLDLTKDFKAGLLKLVHLLNQENAVSEPQLANSATEVLKNLQQKAENTLAKITLDQLNNLPKDDNSKQVWNFDIPFFHKGHAEAANLQIQWEKASQQDDKRPPSWSVNLTLNPPNLGTLYCTIAYQNNTINTYFKSQSGKVTDLISKHLELLKKQLEANGLQTGNMVAQQGNQVNKAVSVAGTQKLFDEQA